MVLTSAVNSLAAFIKRPFDPERGETIIEPPGRSKGYWAGAPSVIHDNIDNAVYLYYRLRQPHGAADSERGFEVRIARSEDGIRFHDIWRLHKRELGSSSIERSSLVKVKEGHYRLYVSYVDPVDNRWRIDVMEAADPASFNPRFRKKVLTALDRPGVEGVKDPYVMRVGDQYFMYFVYAEPTGEHDTSLLHGSGDVHNTGYALASTGIAVSTDGLNFRWVGNAIPVGVSGWDQYQARLTTIIPAGDFFFALWDGSRNVEQNYEEKSAVALTYDLRTFAKATPERPVLETAAGRSVRYVDALVRDRAIWYYYEYTRDDGAHELRVVTGPRLDG